MNKQYDILVVHLLNKIKSFYFGPMADMLIPIGAANTVPTIDDVEYAALVAAMFLLHTNEVEMDSDFPDIVEMKTDILKALAAFDDLKDRLKDFKQKHNQRVEDQALMEALLKDKGLKGEA